MLIDPMVFCIFAGVGLYVTCCVAVWFVPQAIYWLKHKEFMPSVSDLEARQEIQEYKHTIKLLKTERDLETKRADETAALLEETVSKLTNMLN